MNIEPTIATPTSPEESAAFGSSAIKRMGAERLRGLFDLRERTCELELALGEIATADRMDHELWTTVTKALDPAFRMAGSRVRGLSREDFQDAFHETGAALINRIRKGEPVGVPVNAYYFRMAYRSCLRVAVQSQRADQALRMLAASMAERPGHISVPELPAELQEVLKHWIERSLRGLYRAVALCDLQGLKKSEAAASLNVTINHYDVCRHRYLKILRAQIGSWDDDDPTFPRGKPRVFSGDQQAEKPMTSAEEVRPFSDEEIASIASRIAGSLCAPSISNSSRTAVSYRGELGQGKTRLFRVLYQAVLRPRVVEHTSQVERMLMSHRGLFLESHRIADVRVAENVVLDCRAVYFGARVRLRHSKYINSWPSRSTSWRFDRSENRVLLLAILGDRDLKARGYVYVFAKNLTWYQRVFERISIPRFPGHVLRRVEPAMRGGLHCRREHAQTQLALRHGLQPLRRHAGVRQQLPVQGSALLEEGDIIVAGSTLLAFCDAVSILVCNNNEQEFSPTVRVALLAFVDGFMDLTGRRRAATDSHRLVWYREDLRDPTASNN